MANATASRETGRKDSDLVAVPLGAVKVYKGAAISAQVADGYAYKARSGTATDKFLGLAAETIDNSAGAADAKLVRVQRNGTHKVALAGAVQANLGQIVYWADDSTVTLTATNNQVAGKIVEVIDGATVRIDIAPGANA